MSFSEVVPAVFRIELDFVNVYGCVDGDRLTLFDTGIASSAPRIRRAFDERGWDLARLDQIVLSHYHDDHRGSAAELASLSSARVLAHGADAAVVRGDAPQAEPDISEAERKLFESLPAIPAVPDCKVDRELHEGDRLDVLGGARVVSVPGHTPGSMALFVDGRSVLFTGDVVASFDGRALMGPFNADRKQAWASFQKLAEMEFDVARVGHGAPIVGRASERVRDSAQRLERAGAGR